jgi:hypothetical protein
MDRVAVAMKRLLNSYNDIIENNEDDKIDKLQKSQEFGEFGMNLGQELINWKLRKIKNKENKHSEL